MVGFGRRSSLGNRELCVAARRLAVTADLVEVAADRALVAGEAHRHALALVALSGGPRHLALLTVHELLAARKGLARPRVEHLLAHRVATRQRRRCIAAHLRTSTSRRRVGLRRQPALALPQKPLARTSTPSALRRWALGYGARLLEQ